MLRSLFNSVAVVYALSSFSAFAQVPIAPGTTIQTIVNANPAGTTYVLRPGVHRMQTIRPKAGDSYTGEAGAVLSGSRLLTTFVKSGTTVWYATGQTQQGQAVGECEDAFPRCNRPEELFIDSVRQTHVSKQSLVKAGTWYFDYNADRIYLGTNPAGRVVETSVTTQAFQPSADRVTVSNLVVEKYASRGQQAALSADGRSGWTITSNEVRLNHGGGIGIGTGATVRQNFVHHNGQIGIHGVGDDVLVEGNEISYNNGAHYDAYWEGGGAKFALTKRLTVRNNFSHHNAGPGLWTDIDNLNTLYEGNRVEDNDQMGIFHEISFDAIIRNNQVRRNGLPNAGWAWGAGIMVSESANVEVHDNLVEWNGDGIIGKMQDREPGDMGPYDLKNLYVHDNTVSMIADGWTGIVVDDDNPAYFSTKGNRFQRNRYTQTSLSNRNFEWRGDEWTFAQWQSRIGNADSSTTVKAVPR